MSAPTAQPGPRQCLVRLGVRLAVFLVVGAVANTTLVWSHACLVVGPTGHWDRASHEWSVAPDADRDWAVSVAESTFRSVVAGRCFTRYTDEHREWHRLDNRECEFPLQVLPPWSVVDKGDFTVEDPPGAIVETAYGWPRLSLTCVVRIRRTATGRATEIQRGVATSRWSPGMRGGILPTRLLWMGTTLNTLFYAALAWLLWSAPFALRRFIRRRRGQCPACGYPVGESGRCSECGHELAKVGA